MGPGQGRYPSAPVAPRLGSAPHITAMPATGVASWDARLYAGLSMPRVPADTRAQLASALGEIGVEAEFFLRQVGALPGLAPHTHMRGEAFLSQLEAAGRRLSRASAALEVAAQSYLTALEAGFPGIPLEDASAAVWWPSAPPFTLPGEPIELRLRRCGYAYRHVVDAHLATNVEAVCEHLALVLHALTTLPPAGIAPAATLYQGLYELTSMLHGYLVPHHIADLDDRAPGLLSSIARLRTLDRTQDTSLASDIAWAREQCAFVQRVSAGPTQHGLRALFDRSPRQPWLAAALREWRETIAALERLQVGAASVTRRR